MSFQAGFFSFDRRTPSPDEVAVVRNALAAAEGALPDAHVRPGILMAQASADFRTGRLPHFDPDCLGTFDGRLDNRADLMLQLRDALPPGASDAAVAITAYKKWGVDGLVHLVGDWSLAIFDAPGNALILASDFAGVRPLYYSLQPGRVVWSTGLAELAAWTQARDIDDEFVAGVLACGGCRNLTPFRGIRSVPPGHSVRIASEGSSSRRFWNLPIGNTIRYRRESDHQEQLRALFREAVRARLQTNSPVLAELSGGLDSSSIVCMASHLLRTGEAASPALATVTVDHPGSLDAPYCHAVANYCQVANTRIPADQQPFLTESDPGGAVPAFWTRMNRHMAVVARQYGAQTYLTGRPGDLVMGNWGDDSVQVAGLLRTGRVGAALAQSLAWSKVLRVPIYWVLGRALRATLPPSLASPASYRLSTNSSASEATEDSLTTAFRERHGLSDPHMFFSKAWTQAPPEERKHFRDLAETLELRKLQPPEPLQHLDYTHPFAHRPLVEFVFSIPASIICGPGEQRRLMRKAFRELWPAELRKRRSKDYFGGVFLDSLRPLATALLQRRTLEIVERGYVDPRSLRNRLQRMTHSIECNEGQLRHLILLELWLNQHSGTSFDPGAPTYTTTAIPPKADWYSPVLPPA